jgi:hypothetical protein
MLNVMTEATKHERELLDHLIDAALDAIKRARAALMLGMIIVFVFGVAIFNATLSWNQSQVERRRLIYGATVQGYEAVERLIESNQTINNALNNGEGELGYLSSIWKACQEKHRQNNTTPTEMTDLKNAVFSDLDAYLKRRINFDTVGIPFIGISVTGTDYGIVGGLALIVVGYWLLAMLRREHLALNEFVRIDDNNGKLLPGFSLYEPRDLIYAGKRIKHYMVFSISEKGSALGYVTTAIFLSGPVLLMINHLLTAIDVTSKKLGGYIQWHVIVELLVVLLGVIVWIKGLLYQYNSMRIMQYWNAESEGKEPFQNFPNHCKS